MFFHSTLLCRAGIRGSSAIINTIFSREAVVGGASEFISDSLDVSSLDTQCFSHIIGDPLIPERSDKAEAMFMLLGEAERKVMRRECATHHAHARAPLVPAAIPLLTMGVNEPRSFGVVMGMDGPC